MLVEKIKNAFKYDAVLYVTVHAISSLMSKKIDFEILYLKTPNRFQIVSKTVYEICAV